MGMETSVRKDVKDIKRMLSNHVIHRLNSLDDRLDRQESVTLKMLTSLQDLVKQGNTIWSRLKHIKLV